MRAVSTAVPQGDGSARGPEWDHIEQWVAEQLAMAPELSSEQLGRLQALFATAPAVTAMFCMTFKRRSVDGCV